MSMDQAASPSDDRPERVWLIGVVTTTTPDWEVEDNLEELARLTRTAGCEVAGRSVFRQRKVHPGYFIGKGQAEELREMVRSGQTDTLVFDDDLTPAQNRNLEEQAGTKVVDRTQVILDIFAQHARTREGRLQIELARLEYLRPRLRRMWTHLERQRGGIGVRGGPGEQQIEVDRRRLGDRIDRVRRDLEAVRRHRDVLRRGRRRQGWQSASLVGYTNAGKSTLLNTLTGATIRARNQLFVTLDPTTRRLELPGRNDILLSDTVGFIRKLPHHLVEAFKATLEEVMEADLLLHVVDVSHPRYRDQMQAVEEVLAELGVLQKPTLLVYNKADRLPNAARRPPSEAGASSVIVSAQTGMGLDALREAVAAMAGDRQEEVRLRVPLRAGKLLALLRSRGRLLEERYEDGWAFLRARVPQSLASRFERYRHEDEHGDRDE